LGAALAKEAIDESIVFFFRRRFVQEIPTNWTILARHGWNIVLILVFTWTANGTSSGLTGKFRTFVAVPTLTDWIGMKHGRRAVV